MAGPLPTNSAGNGFVPVRSSAFLQRARNEADRYGPDAWVFVRELLQNARDAGATRVDFGIIEHHGQVVLRCRDDGQGMAFAHARRYLFALYASSKEGHRGDVGRFGVGFWSVLRFRPSTITIRSRPRSGPGWSVTFDGELESARLGSAPTAHGTEIVLVRPADGTAVADHVHASAWDNGRFLQTKANARKPLRIFVNGRAINATFALEAPSVQFARGRTRGVVALGATGSVELFSRGIRVRSATCLEDLLSPGTHSDGAVERSPGETVGGLVPRILLESADIEPVLSRTDARDDRALRKVVRLAHRELERLVERQFAHGRLVPWWRRAAESVADALRHSLWWQSVAAAALGGVLAVVLAVSLWGDRLATSFGVEPADGTVSAAIGAPRAYDDLSARYGGPRVDVLRDPPAALDLRYSPPNRELHFAALRFSRIDGNGPAALVDHPGAATPYAGVICDEGCTDIVLGFSSAGGLLRLPVPTGARLVQGSATVDDMPVSVLTSEEGLPMVQFEEPTEGVIRYRVAPSSPLDWSRPAATNLPATAQRLALESRSLPVQTRVEYLRDVVRKWVRYDRSPATAAAHERAEADGVGFLARTLAIGAGDCDVQNGLLAALLQGAGVDARLAIGPIGRGGRALPWLHAWVEYRAEDGQWRALDASSTLPPDDNIVPSDREGTIAAAPRSLGETPRGRTDAAASATVPDSTLRSSPQAADPTRVGGAAGPSELAHRRRPPNNGARPTNVPPGRIDEVVAHAPVPVATAPSSPRAGQWLLWAGLPLGLAISLAMRRRTRRTIALDERPDLSGLLVGALQRPAAFGRLPFIHRRRLVPVLDGSAISLQDARRLAATGRLFSASEHNALTRRAMRAHAAVLDISKREGQGVADALGATDLEHWNRQLDASFVTPFVESLNQALCEHGMHWTIRLSRDLPAGMATLDLSRPGRGRHRGEGRITLIDARDPDLAHYQVVAHRHSGTAIFCAIDDFSRRIRLPTQQRSILLHRAARNALLDY